MKPKSNYFCFILGIDITEIWPEIVKSKAIFFDYKKEREKTIKGSSSETKQDDLIIGLA